MPRIEDEAWIGWVFVWAAPIEDEPDLVARERRHEARDVVLVRVGQDHDVDPPPPPRQAFAESSEQEVWIRASVDEHGGP